MLIPLVRFANEEDVNDILYDWFTGLGDPGWDGPGRIYLIVRLCETASFNNKLSVLIFLQQQDKIILMALMPTRAGYSLYLGVDEIRWLYFEALAENIDWLSSLELVDEQSIRHMADMSWINECYLGALLTAAIGQFNVLSIIDSTSAPVIFRQAGRSNFSNQNFRVNMNYYDTGERLLGLFRLWNAMKYYFPYLDILDDCWNELLLEFIPRMLEGSDRLSYELTLAALSSRLHDAHVTFRDAFFNATLSKAFSVKYGSYVAPVRLTEAEGLLVISGVVACFQRGTPLLPGDVILRLNGTDINEIVSDMLQYVSVNYEQALFHLSSRHFILRQVSCDVPMELDVLREGVELNLYVAPVYENAVELTLPAPSRAYEIFENNIGLINPARLHNSGQIQGAMEALAGTNGLIVDLRHYPGGPIAAELAEYFLNENQRFFTVSGPSLFRPGVFADLYRSYLGGITGSFPGAYFYEKPIVLLMNENTFSYGETTIMALRNGPNITVLGTNSIGANGNVAGLPLPGGIAMMFTGLGIYTPEGGQTQRIGLSPDIRVERTVAGIRQGRDEQLEAAIKFLINAQ